MQHQDTFMQNESVLGEYQQPKEGQHRQRQSPKTRRVGLEEEHYLLDPGHCRRLWKWPCRRLHWNIGFHCLAEQSIVCGATNTPPHEREDCYYTQGRLECQRFTSCSMYACSFQLFEITTSIGVKTITVRARTNTSTEWTTAFQHFDEMQSNFKISTIENRTELNDVLSILEMTVITYKLNQKLRHAHSKKSGMQRTKANTNNVARNNAQ